MKIDPVWLVAPPPKVPSISTRRAFLLAGGCFAAGISIGGACGYSLGASRSSTTDTASGGPATEPDLPKSGDIELDQLRWLAVKAPLDQLFEKGRTLLFSRVSDYPMDAVLWRGVERMCREVIDNPARQVDPMLISMLIGQIEGSAHPTDPSLKDLLPGLRTRRAATKPPK